MTNRNHTPVYCRSDSRSKSASIAFALKARSWMIRAISVTVLRSANQSYTALNSARSSSIMHAGYRTTAISQPGVSWGE